MMLLNPFNCTLSVQVLVRALLSEYPMGHGELKRKCNKLSQDAVIEKPQKLVFSGKPVSKYLEKMLLAIDIGNTNIVIGVFSEKKLLNDWRISTNSNKLADEYGTLISEMLKLSSINHNEFEGIIISSVVPPLLSAMTNMCLRYFNISPKIVSVEEDLGVQLLYDNPQEIGSDRIVNTIGAYEEYGGPLIVVDFGTATSFDAVSPDGGYLGGVIAPGIGISADALFARAARLARVELRRPGRVIGKNTAECIQSGFYYGFLGQMEEIIRRMKEEIGDNPDVIATGGFARFIAADSQLVDKIDANLTLKGLRVLFDRIK